MRTEGLNKSTPKWLKVRRSTLVADGAHVHKEHAAQRRAMTINPLRFGKSDAGAAALPVDTGDFAGESGNAVDGTPVGVETGRTVGEQKPAPAAGDAAAVPSDDGAPPAEWEQHEHEGREFFTNGVTGDTQWHRPSSMEESVDATAAEEAFQISSADRTEDASARQKRREDRKVRRAVNV